MRKLSLVALAFILSLTQLVPAVATNWPSSDMQEVKLFSAYRYNADGKETFFSFEAGAIVPQDQRWDLVYGALYVGDDFDWFQVSVGRENRSIIKDLGANNWTDSFTVPVVEPFPKLKDGERRNISIDASGADGAPGERGRKAAPATNGGDPQSKRTVEDVVVPENAQPKAPPHREPKVDSIFVKAIIGHMYVIHVVDKKRDFYALFRVEALERGDNCTITWKLIPSPEPEPPDNLDEKN